TERGKRWDAPGRVEAGAGRRARSRRGGILSGRAGIFDRLRGATCATCTDGKDVAALIVPGTWARTPRSE
ncbi:MAG TPA: hypothetical protein VE398_20665, partial [Acidobacteriota bacterium]|nr:hypothetical protein [Acidobacteriota bacterium]